MTTISLCMIVKNEEAVLARCLDSVASLMDEIIIVDTGSTDRTKEIAARYTDRIYDFAWVDDFSDFAFGQATCEYIYAPDADEILDEENRKRFAQLKQVLLPEIEIVQMHYLTQSEFNTVQNASDELRPKLFKRLRTFTWIDPIHETIRTDPVVFDSEICILHMPQASHHERDFEIFQKAYERDGRLSDRIVKIKCGKAGDFDAASALFSEYYHNADPLNPDSLWEESACVLARGLRLTGERESFFAEILNILSMHAEHLCGELCYEIGVFLAGENRYDVAYPWLLKAASYESILDVGIPGHLAPLALSECCMRLSDMPDVDEETAKSLRTDAAEFQKAAENWSLPPDFRS